ncbi:MAG: LPS translocon maturation chaperone LptM [Luteimonas sp.]
MNANRFRVLALAIVLVAVLAACGNKGDLVRPTPHAVATASP